MRTQNKTYAAVLAAIILLGICVRTAFVMHVPTEQVYDFATYRTLAQNIRNGLGHTLDGAPVAWQGPLYPYALAGYYRLTGTGGDAAGKSFNIILSALTLVLTALINERLLGSRPRRVAALALAAFLPACVAYNNVLGTEVLFAFLLASVIFMHLYFGGKWPLYPAIGAVAGLLALTKPYMTAFPAVLGLLCWLRLKRVKETAVYVGIVTLCMCAVIAPWSIRNMRLYGRFVAVSYNGGYVRYINNNSGNANGLWMDVSAVPEPPGNRAAIDALLDGGVKLSAEAEPVFARLSSDWIMKNPAEFLKLGFLRVCVTFFGAADDLPQWAMNRAQYASPRDKNAAEAALNLVHLCLSAAGLFFIITHARAFFTGLARKKSAHLPDGIAFIGIVFFVAVVFVSEGQARYAFPVYPFFIYSVLRLLPDRPALNCTAI